MSVRAGAAVCEHGMQVCECDRVLVVLCKYALEEVVIARVRKWRGRLA